MSPESLLGLFWIAFGLVPTVFRTRLARSAAKWNEKLWGLHYSSRTIKLAEWMFLVIGAGFVIVGVLLLGGFI
jgi:hypothetical protein